MKHLKSINEYLSNINEGVNFNGATNADLEEVGIYIVQGSGKNPDDLENKELEKIAIDFMKKTRPIALTGDIKKDATALIKYCVDTFKRAGIALDDKNVDISSDNFANEILIPVVGGEDVGLAFQTYLDYSEMISNGSEMIQSGCFVNDEDGNMDDVINDLGDNGQIVKAAAALKQYMETHNMKNA